MSIFSKPLDLVTKVERHPIVTVKKGNLVHSVKQTRGGFADTPLLKEFAIDIWRMQQGWQWFESGTGRQTLLVAHDGRPSPEKPRDDATAIYQLPIYSGELDGRADLVLDTKPATMSFAAVAETFEDAAEFYRGMVPVVYHVERKESDDGWVPHLIVEEWGERGEVFGPRLIDVPAAPTKEDAIIAKVRARQAQG